MSFNFHMHFLYETVSEIPRTSIRRGNSKENNNTIPNMDFFPINMEQNTNDTWMHLINIID